MSSGRLATRSGAVLERRDAARPRKERTAATATAARSSNSSGRSTSRGDIRTIFNGRRAGNLVHQVVVEVEIAIVAEVLFVGGVDAIVGGDNGVLLMLAVGVHGGSGGSVWVLGLESRRVVLVGVGWVGAVAVGRTA